MAASAVIDGVAHRHGTDSPARQDAVAWPDTLLIEHDPELSPGTMEAGT